MGYKKVKTSDISLLWTCPECGQQFVQALTTIVESGTAICGDCGLDCELEDEVDVEDSQTG